MTGAVTGRTARSHIWAADVILQTCVEMYWDTPTGLAADRVQFHGSKLFYEIPKYLLRPETVESLFLMWRYTHNQKYRDFAWKIFGSIEENCKSTYGYSGLNDVKNGNSKNDLQESYFVAETLKYLYLIFSDDSMLPLTGSDAYVFNTEGHPFSVFYST